MTIDNKMNEVKLFLLMVQKKKPAWNKNFFLTNDELKNKNKKIRMG